MASEKNAPLCPERIRPKDASKERRKRREQSAGKQTGRKII